MPLQSLCRRFDRYLNCGEPSGVVEKAVRQRLGEAWNEFEQFRLNHLEWNPESKAAAEVALARLAGSAIGMLSGDNDRTGQNTLKAMRTLKLCLGI
jgi:hypothetical protein